MAEATSRLLHPLCLFFYSLYFTKASATLGACRLMLSGSCWVIVCTWTVSLPGYFGLAFGVCRLLFLGSLCSHGIDSSAQFFLPLERSLVPVEMLL